MWNDERYIISYYFVVPTDTMVVDEIPQYFISNVRKIDIYFYPKTVNTKKITNRHVDMILLLLLILLIRNYIVVLLYILLYCVILSCIIVCDLCHFQCRFWINLIIWKRLLIYYKPIIQLGILVFAKSASPIQPH